MLNHTAPSDLDLGLLSARERAVVDLAVGGATDEQIAQALDISTSTVNSYWVRIRGKIGQLSRTEVVGKVIRHETGARLAALEAENQALAAEARAAREAQARAESALEGAGGATWPLLALERLAGAALVVRSPGIITYANRQALSLLRADRGDLEGRAVWELTLSEDETTWEDAVRRFFDDPGMRRTVAGVESAHYAVRRDGTNFRVTMTADSFETPEGTMAVVLFREFMDEFDALMRVLRQPLAQP